MFMAERGGRLRGWAYDLMQCLVLALTACVLLFSFALRFVVVDGNSMYPTLHDGDLLVISGMWGEPGPGDIIVFRDDDYLEKPLVKRVIAVGGQTVDIDFDLGKVYVDGAPLDEPYIAGLTLNELDFSGPVTVPEGELFVLGDNRNASKDSRDARLGCVDERGVLGRVYFRILPFDRLGSMVSQ